MKPITLLAALGLALTAIPLHAKDYRLGLITPPSHQWTKTANDIAARLADQTEGRVNILVMPAGQLGNEAAMLQQLQTGAIDFAMLTAAEFANRDADFGVFYAPFIAENTAEAAKLLHGDVAQTLLDRMSDFGLVGLDWGMAGMRQVVTAGQVTTAKDLQGLRIRTVPLAPEMDFWSALGAVPTPIPLPALFDAFANGQVDAMQIDHEGTWNNGYWQHAGTVIHSQHMIFPMAAVASGKSWQGVTEADRALITHVFDEEVAQMNALYADIDSDNLARLAETDVPVLTVGRAWFGSAVDDWYTAWRTKSPLLTVLEQEAAE